MRSKRVNPWLLAAVATATVAILPLSAAVAPRPAASDSTRANEAVRERAERLAEAASGRFSALMDAQDEPRETAELAAVQSQSAFVVVVSDWLERAARDYQSHVIDKLSVSADAAAGGDSGDAPGTTDGGIGLWLKETVRSAFGWLQGWVSAGDDASERETAGVTPKTPTAPADAARDGEVKKDAPQQIASNDRSGEDARDFVEARRKADDELKETQRLAEVREKTAEEKRRAEADLARRKEEAELKAREDARKADLARRHEENQRRINESLKKLDEAQKAGEAKRREAERAKEKEAKKAADRRAALEAEKAAAPPVRANAIPELRLPSAREKTSSENAKPAAEAASGKSATGTKTAASEPPAAAQPKATESVAGEAKPKAERGKSARQQSAKRAKAQRRTREARGPRRKAKLVYVVKPGDTLSGIAERYLGSRKRYDVIYRANRHKIKNPNVIHAYQRIVVPLRKA